MRQCGDCTLCCKLLAVRELGKLAGQRCQHQRHTGCSVYHRPGMPPSCAVWNCRWLVNNDTADQSRPDRSHVVIDVMPDFVTAVEEDGTKHTIEVVQIWCDPKYPDAHRAPAVRAFIKRRAEQGIAALIRYDAKRAFTILAPPFTGGPWIERGSDSVGRDHTFTEIAQAIAAIETEGPNHGKI